MGIASLAGSASRRPSSITGVGEAHDAVDRRIVPWPLVFELRCRERGTSGSRSPLAMARKVRDRGTQMIPGLGARSPDLGLRLEPARIIQAAGPHADEITARGDDANSGAPHSPQKDR